MVSRRSVGFAGIPFLDKLQLSSIPQKRDDETPGIVQGNGVEAPHTGCSARVCRTCADPRLVSQRNQLFPIGHHCPSQRESSPSSRSWTGHSVKVACCGEAQQVLVVDPVSIRGKQAPGWL